MTASNPRGLHKATRPESQPRRGLRRKEAALYMGVSPTTFDKLVKEGALPEPLRLHGVVVWDRAALDHVFDELGEGDDNPWDVPGKYREIKALAEGEGRPSVSTPCREIIPFEGPLGDAGVSLRVSGCTPAGSVDCRTPLPF